MDLQLADRTFIVTGGSAGLGFATAQALVAEGAHVVITSRDPQHCAEAVAALGRRALAFPGDNADPSFAEQVLAAARDFGDGRVHGLLVSVGGPPRGTVLTVTDEQWHESFESVFLGAVRLARAALNTPDALSDDAAIALVLSTSARQPFPGLSISNGLRTGLAMLVKDLADEVGPRGIRVVGLMPGRIDTERVRWIDAQADDPASARAASEAHIPLRRYGRPDEFGDVAAFVLSPRASYLTGSLIAVEGGALRAL